MRAYIEILCEFIEKELEAGKGFNLIKFENFMTPGIYLKVCSYFKNKFQDSEIEFIPKLSKEKYESWVNNVEFKADLEEMDKLSFIEKSGNLTKWRNISFNNLNGKFLIFLMGTESVEDRGGLEEFYKISPEMIESHIGINYDILLKKLNFNYEDEEYKTFNDIIETIFMYTPKDILKLSCILEKESYSQVNYYELLDDILSNLYIQWGIPNIIGITNSDILTGRYKSILNSAYKFSRRIGLEYTNDKKINNLERKIYDYYELYKNDINNEFNKIFSHYTNFEEFKSELIDYCKGINIDIIKPKICDVDFKVISRIINIKQKSEPKLKTLVIKGEPFKALFLPIILEFGNIDLESRTNITQIDVNLTQIKLSGTKSSDDMELKTKWGNLCIFLGGIEKLLSNLYLTNNQGEEICINLFSNINSEEVNERYPFERTNINKLVDDGVLISGSNIDTKSKISMEYIFKNENGEEIHREQYEWHFYEYDIWANTFTMFNCNKFISLIKEDKLIPISISDSINEMIDSMSESELFYLLNNKSFEYRNIYSEFNSGSIESVLTSKLAELFSKSMNDINKYGMFNSWFSGILPTFLQGYTDFCINLKEKIQKREIEDDTVMVLSKIFMLLNNKEINEKYIVGAIIPPYHPIMLERVLERYRYLSNGFKEIFDQIKEKKNIEPQKIYRRFDRFSQLSEVTSSVEFMIGKSNNYIDEKRTLGYYTMFGESNISYCGSNNNSFNFIEDEECVNSKEYTPIAENICKIVKDYIKTYPSKVDGIRVAFYEPKEYKDIISGLHEAVKELQKNKDIKLKIKIDVYISDYRCKGASYFRYWIENNFDEDDNIRIESRIKYMNITNEIDLDHYINKNFKECDITFVNNVMNYKDITEDNIGIERRNDQLINSKYPTVLLPLSANSDRNRRVVVSQPQFKCAYDFSQLMVYVNSKIARDGNYQGIKTVSLENRTQQLLKILNQKSSWVVIMDENIDKKIIEMTGNKIISFATGKGYFGELNLAISTKDEYLIDLEKFLIRRLNKKFPEWGNLEIANAAKMCINYSKSMDGAQIIKAINPSDEAINEYLAFLLTTKILSVDKKKNGKFNIRKLVSVDSHIHLFNENIDMSTNKDNIPDFMLFEVERGSNKYRLENSKIKINVTVIECKLAQKNEVHEEKARLQVKAGYTRLVEIWANDNKSVQDRYWFNQLYRLLIYNNDVNHNLSECNDINSSLYKINESEFEINFSNRVFTYWLDKDFENYINETEDIIEDVKIKTTRVGKSLIKKLLTEDNFNIEEILTNDEDITNSKTDINSKYNKNTEIFNEEKIDQETGKDIYKKKSVVPECKDISIELENNYASVKSSKEKDIIDIINLFNDYKNTGDSKEITIIERQISRLKQEFQLRGIKIFIKDYTIGPDIIRISIEPGVGVDYSKITKHLSDMQIWLAINEEPSIFKEDGFIKIDFARKNRQIVSFKECIKKTFEDPKILKEKEDKLYVLLGADILGNPKVVDLSDSNNPHLLVAGQTGSGKSVLLASMLTSMMVYYTPNELEFLLVDPKMVELTVFEESPFTKSSTTEAEEVQSMLIEVVEEMQRRYKLFKNEKVQNIAAYNKKVSLEYRIKRIVVVIDEYGVLMESGKEFVKAFESGLKKLSQLSRAAGIHLIVCTQSPKAEIITTTIRNNLPARIGLKVADNNASNLILDGSGCEKLLGKGDMLLKTAEVALPIRCKSPLIHQEEITNLNNYFSVNR